MRGVELSVVFAWVYCCVAVYSLFGFVFGFGLFLYVTCGICGVAYGSAFPGFWVFWGDWRSVLGAFLSSFGLSCFLILCCLCRGVPGGFGWLVCCAGACGAVFRLRGLLSWGCGL